MDEDLRQAASEEIPIGEETPEAVSNGDAASAGIVTVAEPESAPPKSGKPGNPSPATAHRFEHIRRLMRDGEFLFQVVFALLVGLVTAIIIVLAGLNANHRTSVVADRAIAGFCVSAMAMFLACFWLNRRGLPLYVEKHAELQNIWVSEPDEDEEAMLRADLSGEEASARGTEGASGDEESAALAEEAGEEAAPDADEATDGFAPLEDSAEHLEAPR